MTISEAFENHKLARRLCLAWACGLITVVCLRVTSPDLFPTISAASATVVTAVIGILTTVIGLYQHGRQKESS
jgi:uncharacterized membrane protein YfcA